MLHKEKAGKILLPSEFELYKSLVSIGIKAPEDELYRLARFAFYQVPLGVKIFPILIHDTLNFNGRIWSMYLMCYKDITNCNVLIR